MTYGDGGNVPRPLVSLDVAGHEMTHGVTVATGGLTYSGESGGLNEATSDIFGTMVEFYANNAADPGDYLHRREIDINGNGTPLRYMDKPCMDGASPTAGPRTIGNLDVHYSSGVATTSSTCSPRAAAPRRSAASPTTRPTCNGSTVTGIGRDKAGKIWYRALTTYMTSGTTYAQARTATLNAATDLYGATSTERATVAAAWSAVSVN